MRRNSKNYFIPKYRLFFRILIYHRLIHVIEFQERHEPNKSFVNELGKLKKKYKRNELTNINDINIVGNIRRVKQREGI